MPIYEFYCQDCNTLFNFLSRRIDTTTQPWCPRCRNVRLRRRPSLFARVGRAKEEGEGPDLPVDEGRMERVIEGLAREAEGLSEDDPRQMARLMRRFSDGTGLRLGSAMEEALSRMEAGEDPDQLEAEMGDLLESEEPFALEGGKKVGAVPVSRSAPRRDDTLYEL
ncbi:MAG: zinc ribbon domain-containing protein [Thermodesulfobacteriota bacterium]